jgi:hypothetical protein
VRVVSICVVLCQSKKDRYSSRKSLFDVPHLLPKSNFRPSSAKLDIWGPSSIKFGYFWSLSSFGRWFSHDVAAIEYIRSLNYQKCLFFVPQLSNLFFPLIVLESDIRMTWRWVNIPVTCRGGTP